MANLMEMLQDVMSDDVLDTLSQQIGAQDKKQTAAAANGIFSTLTSALARNAQKPEQGSALLNAIDRDHDGSVLEDVLGVLSGNSSNSNERALNGSGILKHVLGGKQGNIINAISQMSGLGEKGTGDLMIKLAPFVLGALGKQRRQQNMDLGGIANLLNTSVRSNATDKAEMSLIEQFLDADGDGSIMDDIAEKGVGILGRLFGRKRR
jgi:hypothetical protein